MTKPNKGKAQHSIKVTIPLTYDLTSGRITQESGEQVYLLNASSCAGVLARFIRLAMNQLDTIPATSQREVLERRLAWSGFTAIPTEPLPGAKELEKAEADFHDLLDQLFLDEHND